jgi:putative membrane protein
MAALANEWEPWMIRAYTDHAANERTFLAWVRTGIAVIGFGFVIEKFNVTVLALADTALPESGRRMTQLKNALGSFGHFDGLALILVGIALVGVASVRFVHTMRMLDDKDNHSVPGVGPELILSAMLALLVLGFSIYFEFS